MKTLQMIVIIFYKVEILFSTLPNVPGSKCIDFSTICRIRTYQRITIRKEIWRN